MKENYLIRLNQKIFIHEELQQDIINQKVYHLMILY